jgi:archaemetzincin
MQMIIIAPTCGEDLNFIRIRFMSKIKVIVAILFLLSCGFNENDNNNKFSYNCNYSKNKNNTLVIQPIGNFPRSRTAILALKLKEIYPGRIRVSDPINPPKSCLNYNKKRYRADSLIRYFRRRTDPGFTTVGITNLDISSTKAKNSDFGIMGLGFCPGNACVISSFRIKGRNKYEKFYKVVLHEIAHTEGLQHCVKKNCFMRDAKGKDHLNEEIEFCKSCRSMLIKKGWKL